MKVAHVPRRRILAALLSCTLALAACGGDDESSAGAGDDESSATEAPATEASTEADAEDVTLTLLIDDGEQSATRYGALTDAYTAAHPNVSFAIETRPGGGDGDNIVKTRLATGEMTDIFVYNSGALLQALNPAESIVDLTGDPVLDDVVEAFIATVSLEGKAYGVPAETGMGGGIMYNKAVYAANGLEVPTTWAEFAANNDALLAAGVTPLGASFADTWTSQLLVLADYHNVASAIPTFAEDFTANKIDYATTPEALRSFERLQEAFEKGWWNDDFGSTNLDGALALLANGEIAHYPMLTFAVGQLAGNFPEAAADIGFFAMPGDDAATNGLTLWMPTAMYIAQTSEHIDVAKDFLAFVASVPGTEVMSAAVPPAGPYLVEGATLPADTLPGILDMQAYIDAGSVTPALEYLSPVKGPALEQILVSVGSGLEDAAAGAALYDQDVEKQAQQLGLPGW